MFTYVSEQVLPHILINLKQYNIQNNSKYFTDLIIILHVIFPCKGRLVF